VSGSFFEGWRQKHGTRKKSCHALLDHYSRRPAHHDGATFSLGSVVLLFRLVDQVPETYLLRLIEKHISFAFVREKLRDNYSETGRPSIDPELLLRILLIGYLYGITSERKLVEELRMHLAWRWFTGSSWRTDDRAPSQPRRAAKNLSNLAQTLSEPLANMLSRQIARASPHLRLRNGCCPRRSQFFYRQVNCRCRCKRRLTSRFGSV
jgi:hypothetical protein